MRSYSSPLANFDYFLAAFISLVIIRYCRQHQVQKSDEEEIEEVERERSEQALVVAGEKSQEK